MFYRVACGHGVLNCFRGYVVVRAQIASGCGKHWFRLHVLVLRSAPRQDCTTVMVRHIPPKLSQRQLLRELHDLGFSDRFDFLYIPMDSRRRSNRGIAFVNFATPDSATEFANIVNGRHLRHPSSQRGVEVLPADLQAGARLAPWMSLRSRGTLSS